MRSINITTINNLVSSQITSFVSSGLTHASPQWSHFLSFSDTGIHEVSVRTCAACVNVLAEVPEEEIILKQGSDNLKIVWSPSQSICGKIYKWISCVFQRTIDEKVRARLKEGDRRECQVQNKHMLAEGSNHDQIYQCSCQDGYRDTLRTQTISYSMELGCTRSSLEHVDTFCANNLQDQFFTPGSTTVANRGL